MARPTPVKGNWLHKLIVLISMLGLVYLLAANLFLNVTYLQAKLSSDPDHLNIAWSSGWTFLPGHLHVNNLQIQGRDPQRQWAVSISKGELDLTLWKLFSRTVHLHSATLSGLTVTINSTITESPGATADQNFA
ncbi:MAG: hypothetical protein WBM99_11490, partial [Psychromonas sp.]